MSEGGYDVPTHPSTMSRHITIVPPGGIEPPTHGLGNGVKVEPIAFLSVSQGGKESKKCRNLEPAALQDSASAYARFMAGACLADPNLAPFAALGRRTLPPWVPRSQLGPSVRGGQVVRTGHAPLGSRRPPPGTAWQAEGFRDGLALTCAI